LTQPDLMLDRDTVLDMDARLGKPVSVDVTKRDATMVSGFFNITATVDAGSILGFGVGGSSLADLYSARLGTGATDHVNTQISAHFAQRRADGGTANSPWTIAVGLRESGLILDGYHRTVRDDELATVENRFAAAATRKSDVVKINTAVWPESGPDDWSGSTTVDLPGNRTDYYASEGGVTWKVDLFHEVAGALEEFPDVPAYLNSFGQLPQAYVAGRIYHESWNTGVFGPAFVPGGPGESGLNRTANTFDLEPTLYSDDQGRPASSMTVAAFMRLSRDRDIIYEGEGQAGGFDVPAADGRYTLFIRTDRNPVAGLSTHSEISWKFRSGAVADGVNQKLPVSVVRFRPVLDDHNAAPAGEVDVIGFTVQRQAGAAPARTASLDLRVSYDDGRTWLKAFVARVGETGFALVRRPTAPRGYVSLRSSVTLTDGGSTDQKIIRAYRY
jgi:hypothetical protein